MSLRLYTYCITVVLLMMVNSKFVGCQSSSERSILALRHADEITKRVRNKSMTLFFGSRDGDKDAIIDFMYDIGNRSSDPRYPELIILNEGEENEEIIFNYPEFSGVTISNELLLYHRMIMDAAKEMKMIFTVKYERDEYRFEDRLIEVGSWCINLFPKFDQYKNSTRLILTQAPHAFRHGLPPHPSHMDSFDYELFIINAHKDINWLFHKVAGDWGVRKFTRDQYNDIWDFFDAITNNDGLRIPNKIFATSYDYKYDVPRSKEVLRSFVQSGQFTRVVGYKHEKITSIINSLVRYMNELVRSSVAPIANELMKMFKIPEDHKLDLMSGQKKWEMIIKVFSQIIQGVTNVEQFVKNVINAVKSLEVGIKNQQTIRQGIEKKDIFVILKYLTGRPVENVSHWHSGFYQLLKHLNELKNWELFLGYLYSELPSKLVRYNVKIDHLKIYPVYPSNKIKVADIGFPSVFDSAKVSQQLKYSYEIVSKMELDNSTRLALVKTIQEIKIMIKPVMSCPQNHLVIIKGLVIRSRDINTLMKTSCTENVTQIEVYASISYISDEDMNYQGTTLAILAPEWLILGNTYINLTGIDGENHTEKANPESGGNGLPGKPGGPGGHFLGVTEKLIKEGNVYVYNYGGKGGPGQDGGKGTDGANGTAIKHLDYAKFSDYAYYFDNYTRTYYFPDDNGVIYYDVVFRAKGFLWYEWTLHGTSGGNGTDGGNGGVGGEGGSNGEFGFINLSNNGELIRDIRNASVGEVGKGGKGGKGGESGLIQYLICQGLLKFFYTKKQDYKYKTLPKVEFAKDGADGVAGNATMGKSSRKQPMPYNFYTSVNRYKAFIQETLKESVDKGVLMEFVKNLDANHKIRSLYDHLGFIDELKCYEEQFHSLYKSVDLLPFYKSLEERITDYSYQEPDDRDTKLALLSALTSTSSKVSFFENNAAGYMIIDVQRSMSKIVQEISIIEKIGKELMVNNYVKQYNDELNEQIQNGQELIESSLMPEIQLAFNRIQEAMRNALAGLEMEKKGLEHDKQEAEKAMKIAKKNLIFSSVFNVLHAVADVVQTIHPAIGAVAKAGVGVYERRWKTITPDIGKDPKETVKEIRERRAKSPNRSKDWNKLSTVSEKRRKRIRDWIVDAITKAEQLPKEQKTNEILSLILKLKEYLNTIDLWIRNNLNQLLDVYKNIELEIKAYLNNPTLKAVLDILQKSWPTFVAVLNNPFVSAVTEPLKDFFSTKKEIDNVVNEVEKEMNDVNEFMDNIDDILCPLADDLQSDVTASLMDLSGKKSSELSLSKFQIKDKMNAIKSKMTEIFRGMEAEHDIKHAYNLLFQIVDNIVEANEKIQKFEDQKKYATLQGQLSSSRNLHDVSDQSLYNSLNELNLAIRASGLLVQFERALSALKQYVFPFAYHFLEEFSSLKSLELENNFKDILYTVIPQVQKLYSSLDDWVKNINHHDKIIYQNVHFTNYNKQPFFTFTYSENKETISDLLKGNLVVIRPNIEQGVNKDAVKFNKIRLTFKVLDENIANKFNEVLENFDIRMSHYGYNLYRCGTQYYMIKSGKLTLAYSYKTNKEGRPLRTNAAYKKLSNGGYFLSPFSSWSVQLFRKAENRFDEFKPFLNQPMDLLLEGVGQFIKSGDFLNKTCEEKMKNYYSKYNEYKDFDMALLHN